MLCFVGDGSLQINIQELQTAVDFGTPVTIAVVRDRRVNAGTARSFEGSESKRSSPAYVCPAVCDAFSSIVYVPSPL